MLTRAACQQGQVSTCQYRGTRCRVAGADALAGTFAGAKRNADIDGLRCSQVAAVGGVLGVFTRQAHRGSSQKLHAPIMGFACGFGHVAGSLRQAYHWITNAYCQAGFF